MRTEAPILSRRSFLKSSLAATLAVATGSAVYARNYSDTINAEYIEGKLNEPLLKPEIEPDSMVAGVYAHNNFNHNTDEFGIVGFFGRWMDWSDRFKIYRFFEGQIPMVSLHPHHYGSDKNKPFTYKDLRSQENSIIKQADYLKRFPHCLIRFEYEANAPWFPYGSRAQSPQEFIDGWRFMRELLASISPQSKMMLSLNTDFPIQEYYPGHDWVDMVGLDGYNKHFPNILYARHYHPDPSPGHLFGHDIRTLQDLTETADKNIPIVITEAGIDPERTDINTYQWITEMLETAATYKNVVAACIFGWNKFTNFLDPSEANWGLQITPKLQQFIADSPYYATNTTTEETYSRLFPGT